MVALRCHNWQIILPKCLSEEWSGHVCSFFPRVKLRLLAAYNAGKVIFVSVKNATQKRAMFATAAGLIELPWEWKKRGNKVKNNLLKQLKTGSVTSE